LKEDCDGSSKEKNVEKQNREPQGSEYKEADFQGFELCAVRRSAAASPGLPELRLLQWTPGFDGCF
jgi:hypothetical protein